MGSLGSEKSSTIPMTIDLPPISLFINFPSENQTSSRPCLIEAFNITCIWSVHEFMFSTLPPIVFIRIFG